MTNLVPKQIIDKNGKQTTVKVNPNLDGTPNIDRTSKLGGAPSVVELLGAKPQESLDTFIPTRFPYTYGIDFVRGKLDVVPESVAVAYLEQHGESIQDVSGSRGSVSGLIHLWAEMEGIDDESLFVSLANAYLDQSGEKKATEYFDTGYEGIDVEAGYPEPPNKNYNLPDNRDNEVKLHDLARYHQQFSEDGYLFDYKGQVYVDHDAMPVEISRGYWTLYRNTDTSGGEA